jgi:hypothetical protein
VLVEWLKVKALSSSPSTKKKKKEDNEPTTNILRHVRDKRDGHGKSF